MILELPPEVLTYIWAFFFKAAFVAVEALTGIEEYYCSVY